MIATFNKKELLELNNRSMPTSISIYVPTNQAGVDELGRIGLKTGLKRVREQLEDRNLPEEDQKKLLAPIEMLLDDEVFWQHQSDGLVVFRTASFFRYYRLPVHFKAFQYVADHFYLKPLLPMVNRDRHFFLLALSQNSNRLFECTPDRISEVFAKDLVPKSLEASMSDQSQAHLQHHSTGQNVQFHGQGAGKDDQSIQREKYLRQVDEGICKLTLQTDVPLVLAAVDFLASEYRKVSQHPHIWKNALEGNPDHLDMLTLHQETTSMLRPLLKQEVQQTLENIQEEMYEDGYAIDDTLPIVEASMHGKVARLLVRKDEKQWASVNKHTGQLTLKSEKTNGEICVLNRAIVETLRNGGHAYLVNDIPTTDRNMAALLRY